MHLSFIFADAWTAHMAQNMARMAESGRAKIKEVSDVNCIILEL